MVCYHIHELYFALLIETNFF